MIMIVMVMTKGKKYLSNILSCKANLWGMQKLKNIQATVSLGGMQVHSKVTPSNIPVYTPSWVKGYQA